MMDQRILPRPVGPPAHVPPSAAKPGGDADMGTAASSDRPSDGADFKRAKAAEAVQKLNAADPENTKSPRLKNVTNF